jgi:beta-1,4-mannosyltransferase
MSDPLERREDRHTGISGRVAFFPSAEYLAINPYWPLLKRALQGLGAEVVASTPLTFGRRWLWAHRHEVRILHIHFVQPFYAYETVHARLRWVVRFARNLLLARAFGYWTVFTLHDLRPPHPLRPAWVDYLGYWVAANLSHRVIVHCEAARAALRARYGRRAGVHVVEHPSYIGVHPNDVSRDDARVRLGIAADERVFLFFGSLRLSKGLGSLVTAFPALAAPEARLLIAGVPDLSHGELERFRAQCAADPRIRLDARYISDDEVGVFMNAADAVVLPFADILTSSSVILAMSFGRAVVAPARGCLPELLAGDAGVLYDPHTPDALLAALEHCLTADLTAVGNTALERMRERTWCAAAQQTLAVYARAPAEPSAR